MGYLGNDLQVAYSTYKNIDDISGSFNGSTTSFSLLVGGVAPVPLPLNSQQCLISVGGVIQRPDDTGAEGFRLSSGNIVFSSAPSTGEDFFGVILAGADYVNVGANFPSGSAAVPSITFDSDLDTGIYNSGANQVSITTAGTERLRITSAGLVGIGTSTPQLSIGAVGGNVLHLAGAGTTGVRVQNTSGNSVDIYAGTDGFINQSGSGTLNFQLAGSTKATLTSTGLGIGTNSASKTLHVYSSAYTFPARIETNGTGSGIELKDGTTGANAPTVGAIGDSFYVTTNNNERFRVDSSGRLLVGTSSAFTAAGFGTPNNQFVGDYQQSSILLRNNANDNTTCGLIFQKTRSTSIVQQNDSIGWITFNGYDGVTDRSGASIYAAIDGTPGSGDLPSRLVFSTCGDGASSPTVRTEIKANGSFRTVADTGIDVIYATTPSAAGTSVAIYRGLRSGTAGTPGSGTDVFLVFSNGTVQNATGTYTTISDAKLKENIVDANSQWNDLKNIKIRNWNFKEETGQETHRQLGPIAQELEEVCPGLVFEVPDKDEDGNELGTATKGVLQSVLYMKAVKALQEAMERIEQLEAKVAVLETP